jgi:hypothetical protein
MNLNRRLGLGLTLILSWPRGLGLGLRGLRGRLGRRRSGGSG